MLILLETKTNKAWKPCKKVSDLS